MKHLVRAGRTLQRAFRQRKYRAVAVFAVLVIGLVTAALITPYRQQPTERYLYSDTPSVGATYLRAKIQQTHNTTMTATLLDGERAGQTVTVDIWRSTERRYILQPGTVVVVGDYDNANTLQLVEVYRIPLLIIVATGFAALVVAVGGRRGGASIVGLALSIVVIGWLVVPAILQGADAFAICCLAAFIIAIGSMFIAHGFRWRTLVSVGCVVAVLAVVCGLAYLAVVLGRLTGLNDEGAYYLLHAVGGIDMRGLVAGGIVIAALGMLDDVVTAQVAAVEELKRANQKMTVRQLYTAGASVGGEHIASLVNTLALAYVGVSLPFILLTVQTGVQTGQLFFNGEYIATEIIRTLVASAGLVLAVPISTLVAAYCYDRLARRKAK